MCANLATIFWIMWIPLQQTGCNSNHEVSFVQKVRGWLQACAGSLRHPCVFSRAYWRVTERALRFWALSRFATSYFTTSPWSNVDAHILMRLISQRKLRLCVVCVQLPLCALSMLSAVEVLWWVWMFGECEMFVAFLFFLASPIHKCFQTFTCAYVFDLHRQRERERLRSCVQLLLSLWWCAWLKPKLIRHKRALS